MIVIDHDKMREAMARIREVKPGEGQDLRWVWELLPKTLPGHWKLHTELDDGAWYQRVNPAMIKPIPLRVCVSGMIEQDGLRWLHVSASHPDRIPSWDDLREVKNLFIGEDKLALQVLPKVAQYVNLNPFVLHLWHCVDKDPTPDFTWGTGSV